ncbi:ATP-dependent metallopeptidase FtsH/Yme1/Tma family protein [Marinobacter nanhaiticus D15-8W]|uniref:ATP-dependent zinc metalloprotease FtsH n=2 Tax=Marinobacter TaxID=2742 RepID=N6WPI9_9GAMM|nr:ATP-dependent metallopeptidase FtsH/Yme1/Tma family protein [Marinobacter nanhaiticus D15-8W]
MSEAGQKHQGPKWFHVLNLLLLMFVLFYVVQLLSQSGAQNLSYTEFKERVQAGQVQEVTIEGRQVRGTLTSAGTDASGEAAADQPTGFNSQIPEFAGESVLDLLEQNGVTINAVEDEPGVWSQLLINLLPWVLIVGLLIYVGRRMQQRMGDQQQGIFGFSKSKAKRFSREDSSTSFDDVAGSENAKKDLAEIVQYLREPGFYRRLGAKLPRGVLMVGPPGTGKTLMARAVAGEAGVPFYSISGSEFIEMFVGVGASRVRDMFAEARKESPAIIFIDELDAIGRARGAGVGGGHDEREQTLNQILSEMDGFSPSEAVVVIAATNRPDVLDSALLRPGRFDRKVLLDRPHREARERILKVHSRDVPLDDSVDINMVARRTVGFSGADLENLVNEAALNAGRENANTISMDHFDKARDKIIMGAEREQRLSDDEKEVIAYHESGHALTALLFPKADRLEKVTIIPRGQALGLTEQAPDEDRLNMTASYAKDRIAVMLGGRVSEKLIYDEYSSGAENDLEQATKLARRMVSRWGMSDEIGPISIGISQEEVFLGHEISRERDFSEATVERVDQEVRKLITGIERKVEQALKDNREKLDELAHGLLDSETLEADEIDRLLGFKDDKTGDSREVSGTGSHEGQASEPGRPESLHSHHRR